MFLKNFLKNTKITTDDLGIFTSVSSSTFLTASWLAILLLTNMPEPRFQSHTKSKISKTLAMFLLIFG